MPLHKKILISLLAGALAGVAANALATEPSAARQLDLFISRSTEPLGRMWLSSLIMIVVPLILSTLSLGVAGLGSLSRVGRIGALTLVCFAALTAASAVLGLLVMNVLSPGAGLDSTVKERLLQTYRDKAKGAMGLSGDAFSFDLLVRIVPRNPIKAAADGDMLAIIFFALMIGLALSTLPRERGGPMSDFLESLGHVTVTIIELVMKVAPLGVFCLLFSVTARFGLGLLYSLLAYAGAVLLGLLIFQLVFYPILLSVIAGQSPMDFLRRARLVMLTAFSTSSSSATLPTTLRVAQEEMGIPREIAGFVLPLGATLNMNGTALFEGATVLFLAQVFGVELSLSKQAVVVLMSVVTAIGAAGIPGGSIPLLMMVLGMVGVPAEGIAIILGVDRILDMCRTVLNVSGDLVTAAVVQRFERGRGALPG